MLTISMLNILLVAPPIAPKSGLQTSDIIALGAATISIISLFMTIYSSYLNKQLEIKFLKFGKLVIGNLDELFLPLDQIFKEHPNNLVGVYLTNITEALVDVELFIIHFQNYYSTLNIQTISDSKDTFSDSLYNNPTIAIKDAKINYLAFKTYVYNELYDFARMTDIGPLHRLIAKIKSWSLWNFFKS